MLPPATDGALVHMSRPTEPNGASRVLAITDNKDALDYRLALIDSARSSLDIQMFFWLEDLAGRVMLERVFRAADRGVRVRLLWDDLVLGLSFSDGELATINSHPNVQLRIYNPFHKRGGLITRSLQMWTNPEEKNQRLHNKTIIADHAVAIVSGRNVGSHCFGFGKRYNLIDLGAIATGPVVRDMGRAFDQYWNSGPTYDVSAFHQAARHPSLAAWRAKNIALIHRENNRRNRGISLQIKDWSGTLEKIADRMQSAQVRYLADDPELPCRARRVIDHLLRVARTSRRELILVTPYIVPDRRMVDMISSLRSRGVRVCILLPSVGSNNHPIVHNQYEKYRRMLLGMGVELYEFKHQPGSTALKYLNEGDRRTRKVGLHSKAMIVDARRSFIGTLNLDGRALFVNTEEGLFIDSAQFARPLRRTIEQLMLPENAWRVSLDEHGNPVWRAGKETRHTEPTINVFQASLEWVLRPFHLKSPVFPDQQVYRHAPSGN